MPESHRSALLTNILRSLNKSVPLYLFFYPEFLYLSRLYVAYLHTDIQIKTFSKTLLSITINNMKNAISKAGPNIVFYSGHDITVAFMLVALNFTNLKCLYQKYMMNQSV